MIKSSHNHPFHMVTISPWPLMTSLCLFNCAIGLIKFFHANNMNLILLSIFSTILMLSQWWRDIIRESTFQGNHTKYIQSMLKFSMVMFIMSELMFFVSFFWAYFHMALSPSIEIGSMWPPMGIVIFNPYSIPLLNTIILVSSGISITWCHYSIINNKFKESLISLILTCFLGLFFTFFQVLEYYEAPFTINDSVYGSIFFVTTGFHGLHVIIGTIFLTICLLRLFKMHFSSKRHFGFEAAAWYWHFVDVIWLFLYICMYWWIF